MASPEIIPYNYNSSMKENLRKMTALHKMENCQASMKDELLCLVKYEKAENDILIVVHNQLDYVKKCIESIKENTENYNIFIWDNASDQETREYLESISKFSYNVGADGRSLEKMICSDGSIMVLRSEENIGFIEPNNRLFELGLSDYVILLNSDTEVKPDWDKAMISWLQQNEDVGQTGYMGGILNDEFRGGKIDFGSNIDYICGWAMCVRRDLLDGWFDRLHSPSSEEKRFFQSKFDEEPFFNLFDQKNLNFAYAEDADLSLRIKEHGFDIYALHLDLVLHHENKTIKAVNQSPDKGGLKVDLKKTFHENHEYLKRRWSTMLNMLRTGRNVPEDKTLPLKDL
jgi:cellulose synthase/poly-beta-1,6-N-acetylglucosamine synthase-like glycosyltransferase